MAVTRWRVLLVGIVSLALAACSTAPTLGRLPRDLHLRWPFSAPSSSAPSGSTPDPATQAAIQLVIQRGNFEQEQAIAARDPSPMRDTATASYYQELVQLNQELLANGVTRIHLDALEW